MFGINNNKEQSSGKPKFFSNQFAGQNSKSENQLSDEKNDQSFSPKQMSLNTGPSGFTQTNSSKPENQTKPTNTSTNNNSFGSKVSGFFRLIGILFVLFLLVSSSLFAFLVVNPENNYSKWLVNNTPLNKVLGLNTNSNNYQDSKTDSSNPINNILGLNKDESNLKFAFAPETSPKTTVETVSQVLPSVVSILVQPKISTLVDRSIAGTGYIVDPSGLIVTNKHVIASTCELNSPSKIVIITNDQKAIPAVLVSVDPINDIAILKMSNPPENLTSVKLADSDKLQLGSEVIAVGNSLGELDNSVTKGIISGLSRNLSYPDVDECTGKKVNTDGLIQTDAAINRGNSGGPLFDAMGRLVGMNTFGATVGENIGLAIPSNTIKLALESFDKTGKITRARLGVSSQSISPYLKQTLDLPLDYGEIILSSGNLPSVTVNSAAAKAGLGDGDIILEVNGQRLISTSSNPSPLKRFLGNLQAETKINLTILKVRTRNGQKYTYKEISEKVEIILGGVSVDLLNPQA